MRQNPKLFALAAVALAALFMATAFAANNNNLQGTLSQLAADDYAFTVTDQAGSAHNFRLEVDGNVTINNQQKTMWDLRVGDHVKVGYIEEGNNDFVATSIRCDRK